MWFFIKYKFQNWILVQNQLKTTISSKWEIAPQQLLYCNQIFSWFGTHFDGRPKVLTDGQIPSNTSQAQSNWFIFKKTSAYKRRFSRSVYPRCEHSVSSTTPTHGNVERVLSSVFTIVQRDIRNRIFYLISWLQKKKS